MADEAGRLAMLDALWTRPINNARLAVIFTRGSDRFEHSLQLVIEDQHVPVLASIEGTSAEKWPPSPALQHLHFEPRPAEPDDAAGSNENRVALLVGMAGRSHWSMSVETSRDASSLIFDVACRVDGSEWQQLQSAYVVHGSATLEAGGLQLETLGRRLQLSTDDVLMFEDRRVEIRPRPADARTIRWKYRIELVK